ncbi:MAG: hypothetical protein OSA97_17665, partial [Nevskia sp.]|nr:hypothetical protein [Nevskia sp.]
QPYSSIPTGGGNTVTGLGDPLVDVLVYTRPVDNLMLGLGNFVSIPVGSNEISTHAWIDLPNLVGDYKIGKFGIDGTLALGVFSQVHNGCTPANGCAVPGNLRMSEIALRYQVAPWFGPFVSYINQGESHGSFSASGVQFAGNHENDVGAGARFSISHTNWFSVWYYTGVSGQNTGKESGVYFKYVTGI